MKTQSAMHAAAVTFALGAILLPALPVSAESGPLYRDLRSQALGRTGVASSSGATALFLNPAALAGMWAERRPLYEHLAETAVDPPVGGFAHLVEDVLDVGLERRRREVGVELEVGEVARLAPQRAAHVLGVELRVDRERPIATEAADEQDRLFGEIRPVLAGDSGDQCTCGHRMQSVSVTCAPQSHRSEIPRRFL